ncbi:protein PHR1-LIKE 2-like [Tasmannia lanceolata]|uniref:protein PHR1-LIKE 2-like n=1 Tax=Tasmannia lanceolata TaxID=3420 RepID=UPI004063895F
MSSRFSKPHEAMIRREESQRSNLPFHVLIVDSKPRLRWTTDLHERFVRAVTQLGGPSVATPKSIMRTMGVKGVTLFHLKSHLQKYRLAKKSGKDLPEKFKDACYLSDGQGNNTSSPAWVLTPDRNNGCEIKEASRAQMEGRMKLHKKLEIKKNVEEIIAAQTWYLNRLLEHAKEVLANETVQEKPPTESCLSCSNGSPPALSSESFSTAGN